MTRGGGIDLMKLREVLFLGCYYLGEDVVLSGFTRVLEEGGFGRVWCGCELYFNVEFNGSVLWFVGKIGVIS